MSRVLLSMTEEEAEALRCLLFGWPPPGGNGEHLLDGLSDRLGLPIDPETGKPVDPMKVEGTR